jgi:L-amino acid N-acyltransferase
MIIRPATPADLPAILAIYNEAVLNTTAIWNWHAADLANRQAWFEARAKQDYPILVAGAPGEVLGYASFGDWRPFDGYCHTIEHSIYVAHDARGKGLGATLLSALIAEARARNKHIMLGGIEAGNAASIALHRRFGFVETGRMPEVGQKFGKWLDLVFMQLKLGN